jgi:hypothetical protein
MLWNEEQDYVAYGGKQPAAVREGTRRVDRRLEDCL